MTKEQRFPLTDIRRVNLEVDVRDVDAHWSERDDMLVLGDGIEAFVETDELFIGSTRNQGKVEIELPLTPLNYAFKVDRGDITLLDARGKIDVRLDSGDFNVRQGNGALSVSSGKGHVKVDTFAGEVTANSGSGDKTFNDVTGGLIVRTGKGDTRISRGSGSTIVATGSGDVVINDRDMSNANVASASGDVIIRGGRIGKTSIDTASGDIVCQAALTIATYDVTAASGDVLIAVPRDLPARVDAATTRGSINSDLPLVSIGQRGPRNPYGKRVVGSTSDVQNRAEITVRTSSGDIGIRWSADKMAPAMEPDRPVDPEPDEAIPIPVRAPHPTDSNDVPHEIFDDDRRRVILAALADGSISVEEASQLLDAIGRSADSASGAR